jgi:DNA polymerase/3'-5' exonuclease PolX
MTLARAKAIALILDIDLRAFCDVVIVGGSIRRECESVGDIEIICQPKANMRNRLGMYLMEHGTIKSGKMDGRYVRVWLSEHGVQLDLFMPQLHDFYRQLIIRTGSAGFVHNIIATQWVRMGWVGTDDGLRRREECVQKTSGEWVCRMPSPTLPPVWDSEKAVFEWLELDYVEPKDRK